MTREFKILFHYNQRNYNARVIKNASGRRIDYAVRPRATTLVREYGKQILIFKENGSYRCESQVSLKTPEYINALVNAIKEQDTSMDGRMSLK